MTVDARAWDAVGKWHDSPDGLPGLQVLVAAAIRDAENAKVDEIAKAECWHCRTRGLPVVDLELESTGSLIHKPGDAGSAWDWCDASTVYLYRCPPLGGEAEKEWTRPSTCGMPCSCEDCTSLSDCIATGRIHRT